MDEIARVILERGVYIDIAYQYKNTTFEAYDREGELLARGKSEPEVIDKTIKKLSK